MSRAKGRRRRRRLRKTVESIRRMKIGYDHSNLGHGVILALVKQGTLSVSEAYRILQGESPVSQ